MLVNSLYYSISHYFILRTVHNIFKPKFNLQKTILYTKIIRCPLLCPIRSCKWLSRLLATFRIVYVSVRYLAIIEARGEVTNKY